MGRAHAYVPLANRGTLLPISSLEIGLLGRLGEEVDHICSRVESVQRKVMKIAFLCALGAIGATCEGKEEPDYVPRGKSEQKAPDIHSDELEARISLPDAVTFVLFETSWCIECQAVRPLWDNISKSLDFYDGTRVVVVDCDGGGVRACSAHQVWSLPSIKAFGGADSVPLQYWGSRADPAALWAWVSGVRPTLSGPLKRAPVLGPRGETLCEAWRASEDCDPEGPRVSSKVRRGLLLALVCLPFLKVGAEIWALCISFLKHLALTMYARFVGSAAGPRLPPRGARKSGWVL